MSIVTVEILKFVTGNIIYNNVCVHMHTCIQYGYKLKTRKGKMTKDMLKRRKESGTYLATDSRHRCSVQMMMKNDN